VKTVAAGKVLGDVAGVRPGQPTEPSGKVHVIRFFYYHYGPERADVIEPERLGYFYPTPRKGKNKGLLISEEFITYCFNWSQYSWHPLAEGQSHPRKFWPLCDNLSELSAYCTMIFA
jgi:hypothetical protein